MPETKVQKPKKTQVLEDSSSKMNVHWSIPMTSTFITKLKEFVSTNGTLKAKGQGKLHEDTSKEINNQLMGANDERITAKCVKNKQNSLKNLYRDTKKKLDTSGEENSIPLHNDKLTKWVVDSVTSTDLQLIFGNSTASGKYSMSPQDAMKQVHKRNSVASENDDYNEDSSDSDSENSVSITNSSTSATVTRVKKQPRVSRQQTPSDNIDVIPRASKKKNTNKVDLESISATIQTYFENKTAMVGQQSSSISTTSSTIETNKSVAISKIKALSLPLTAYFRILEFIVSSPVAVEMLLLLDDNIQLLEYLKIKGLVLAEDYSTAVMNQYDDACNEWKL